MQIRVEDYITACAKNDTFVIKQCIDAKIPMPKDNNSEKDSGFATACRMGHLETVQLFLERMKYDDSSDIQYGLMLACMSSKSEVVDYLLKNYKETFNLLCENSTFLSLTFGREKIFYQLVEHDISFDTEDNKPTIIRDSFFHRQEIFKTTLEKSNAQQINNFISDLILRGDKKFTQGSDQNINIENNSKYNVLFSYLKNLEEDRLVEMKNVCERYTSLHNSNETTIKNNAEIFLEKINNYLLFYKLDRNIENKKDNINKKKI